MVRWGIRNQNLSDLWHKSRNLLTGTDRAIFGQLTPTNCSTTSRWSLHSSILKSLALEGSPFPPVLVDWTIMMDEVPVRVPGEMFSYETRAVNQQNNPSHISTVARMPRSAILSDQKVPVQDQELT